MGKANGTFSLLSGLSIATPLSFFVKVADVAFVTIERLQVVEHSAGSTLIGERHVEPGVDTSAELSGIS